MASQLQSLKESGADLKLAFGADNPYVKGMKAQIASLDEA